MKDVKIFVCNTCGQDNERIPGKIYQPIYGGKSLASGKTLNPDIIVDDTGDNISNKNRSYCELTVQYWAWKNVEADYYGFCHYRRYFAFAGNRKDKDVYGNIIDEYITPRTITKYGLDEQHAMEFIEGADIVVTDRVNVLLMPECYTSIREHYKFGCGLNINDVDLLLKIISDISPEYSQTANEYFAGYSGYFCNMFIMRKEIFCKYSQWLFKILSEFDKRSDMSHYSIEGYRTPGHLAERLCGIFIDYQLKSNPSLKVKEIPCVMFRHPQLSKPLAKTNKRNAIPIVFAANNSFVPPLSVAIKSILNHSSTDYFYDVVVLESDISKQNKSLLSDLVSCHPNSQIRFCNALPFIDGYTLVPHAHITKETFFRFIIQSVMPEYDKVLYLDGDIIVQADIAELYSTDITGRMLAAVHDIDFASQINGYAPNMMKYAKTKLHMKDPYQYFQAGVLLLNLAEMRKAHTLSEWLELASVDYKYSDQDVLNSACEGKVVFLPQRWNLIFDNDFSRVRDVLRFAPRNLRIEYDEAANNPNIIHYAGFGKPWLLLPADHYVEFWEVAKQTPFYEALLYNMLVQQGRLMAHQTVTTHIFSYHRSLVQRIVSAFGSATRRIADGLVKLVFPIGSKRREKMQLKWRAHVMKNVSR